MFRDWIEGIVLEVMGDLMAWRDDPDLQVQVIPSVPHPLGCGGPVDCTPIRGSGEAAGLDLVARERAIVAAGETIKIPVGIKTSFKPGWVALIRDRSGMGSKGKTTYAGVIDSDYRGEWLVALHNSTNMSFNIIRGDRIAQFVMVRCWGGKPKIVDDIGTSDRGEGGFGSTGA